MKKNILLPLLLLVAGAPAYCQFNTIKKIKILPQIQLASPTVDKPVTEDPLIVSTKKEEIAAFENVSSVSMPLSNPLIVSSYGWRADPFTGREKMHWGLDFKGSSDSVSTIMSGKVKRVAYSRSLGNYVEIAHGEFNSIYGHLSFVLVGENKQVRAGTVIGITGNTGRSTGEHLHFAIKHKGKFVNPVPFLDIIYRTTKLKRIKRTGLLSQG